MATVLLFHSVLGLRPVELQAAERLRADGHDVTTPDLYDGRTAETLDDGFALNRAAGRDTLVERALSAAATQPDDAVLAGVSMGASVVRTLLPHRPHTAGVLALHALPGRPETVRDDLPVQIHVADPDPFVPPADLAAWQHAASTAAPEPSATDVHTHPGLAHFFTDPASAGYDPAAAALTWQRAARFLAGLGSTR